MRVTDSVSGAFAVLVAIVFGSLGGFGMLLSFPNFNLWMLIYPSVATLFWMLLNLPGAAAFLGTLCWSAAFFIPHISWISISTRSYGPWLALAGVQITWMLAWALVMVWARKKVLTGHPIIYGIGMVLTFAGVEQARAHAPWGGFAWGITAYAQVDSPLSGLIPWIGEVGVQIIVGMIALAIAVSITSLVRWWWRLTAIGGVVAAFAASLALVPSYHQLHIPAAKTQNSITVSAVQGNVSREYPKDLNEANRIMKNHVQVTKDAGPGADLYVWGEQSADMDPRADATAKQLINEALNAVKAPILAGTLRYEEASKLRYNEALLFQPGGQISAVYTKQRPVPFGEYLPAREFFSKLTSDVEQIPVDMAPGTKPAVIEANIGGQKIRLAVGICFEVAIDSIMRQGVENGGELLIIPTNNASFGFGDESVQQLQMVRFRALEYHRAAVSASINGVSALIDANGQILRRTNLFTAAEIRHELQLYRDLTPAYWVQPYAPITVMSFFGVWAIWSIIGIRRKKVRI